MGRSSHQGEIDDIVSGRPNPAIDPPFLGDRLKEVIALPDGFSTAQKQMSALTQGEMTQRDNPFLCIGIQIDEQITAGNQVHT